MEFRYFPYANWKDLLRYEIIQILPCESKKSVNEVKKYLNLKSNLTIFAHSYALCFIRVNEIKNMGCIVIPRLVTFNYVQKVKSLAVILKNT
jgi:hypothetical protein